MKTCPFPLWLALALSAASLSAAEAPGTALAIFTGTELEGGARDVVGASFAGEEANTIYALPTGPRSVMRAQFLLQTVPPGPLFVHLKGRDDDAPSPCAIRVRLNDKILLEGPNRFRADRFETQKLEIPEGTLARGTNLLTIECREAQGSVGQPPWFQVASLAIAPGEFFARTDLHQQFVVQLPAEPRPFPEPLPAGAPPGFRWRGTKGWAWTPEQYLEEIPWLAKFKMNFLMNCYLSMFDLEHHTHWADGQANRWWEELPAAKQRAYARVVRACQERKIEFCFGMNPNLASSRFIQADAPADLDALYQHYAWMQSLGVRWFNISLDDISKGIDASSHARVVNTILSRLREKDPNAEMIFCPTYYWGDGTEARQRAYLEILARELDPRVWMFWTGDAVVGRVTRRAAETFRRISGHRLFLWDNYPVNDDTPAMHLGPVTDRDLDLGEVVDGYMGNPHRKQNQANRLPLATCADYAYNPAQYDPARSIGQAILQVGETSEQRGVLRDLVEAYPGMLLWSPPHRGTSFNSVQAQFNQIVALRHSRTAAAAYVKQLELLAERMERAFPGWIAERQTLQGDLESLRQKLK